MLIKIIGLTELLVGLITFIFVIIFNIFSIVQKPPGVFVFVIISAVISASIGVGILNYRNWARILLVFFSGYVIALKFLLYLGVIRFTGEIIAFLPSYLKNIISVLYHIFLIICFTRKKTVSKFKF